MESFFRKGGESHGGQARTASTGAEGPEPSRSSTKAKARVGKATRGSEQDPRYYNIIKI